MIKNFKRHILMPLAIASMAILPFASAQAADHQVTVNVTLLTASDMDTMTDNGVRGGAARLAAVIKAERAANANTIYAYPGDLLSPSIMGGFDKGAHMVELLNMAAPDVLTPGNHEFDFGHENFLARMGEGKFTKLGSNIRWKDGSKIDGFEDNIMFEFEGIKIGYMGMTTQDTIDISSPGDVIFTNTLEAAKANAKALRDAGADMVVAVVHESQAIDFDLINRAGIDVVQSGHDHNLHIFYDGRRVIVESKEEAEYVVAMDIEFTIGKNRDGSRRVRWWPNFRIIDTATVTPDAKVAAVVAKYEATLSEELDIVIGTTEVELDTRRISVRTGENAFGNFIADSLRKAVNSDIAFTNGGGIRANKLYTPGVELTRRDILSELPFGNTNVKLELTGAIIIEVLEHSVRAVPEASGGFMHVSGMTFDVDSNAAVGSRVSNVMIGGNAIDLGKIYTASTNNFVAGGGDGYSMLRGANNLIDPMSAKFMASDVMDNVRAIGAISPSIEGRINIK
ncbi:MAG: 5'-nucleotidase C-terminal domain-containing protein [Rhizobiales bacterium]|nr:5'-nucleotidase C-terminal domain-containing protein [Hyphomicrobiales bacterium]NRB14840.1 5'-nucleotidase C-terminal domain-containing protein [Hyphomicrobiales bacterium]